MKLKLFLVSCLILCTVCGIAVAQDDSPKILLNGEDVTSQYLDNPDEILGSLIVYTTSSDWGVLAIEHYIPEIREGYNIRTYNINGRIGSSYSFSTSASAGADSTLDITGMNTNIEDVAVSEDGIQVSTSGHGVGHISVSNARGAFYQIKENGEVVGSGNIMDGKFTYQFTQSEHIFIIKVSGTPFEDITPPEEEVEYGKIIVNGKDVTDKYITDATHLRGDLIIRTDKPTLVKYCVQKYLPKVIEGYDINFTFINGKMTTSYGFSTSATATGN